MKKHFKVGDWCFSHFELCQIKEMKGNRITSVTTGIIERGGNDLTYSCFPMDMRIKRLSDNVEYYAKRLHEIKSVNLNYPDIIRSLEERWIEMCESTAEENLDQLDKLQSFVRRIIEKAEAMRYESVDGIGLIR